MNHLANFNNRMIIASQLLVIMFFLLGCVQTQEPVDEIAILSRVRIGDTRTKALEAFSDAWFHSSCVYESGTVEDIFFYGPKDPYQFFIIMTRSTPTDKGLIVRQAGTLEYYFLDSLEDECFQPPLRSAFEN